MNKITHVNATTIAEATSALSGGNAAVIAGGQDILTELKAMISPNSPTTLVNIKGIPGLSDLTEDSGGLKIGALVTLTEVAESAAVKSNYAALAEAARRSCSPEIRNVGTIGGNICQKVRCWYYRTEFNGFDCLRKNPAGICNALVGDNRFNSIFGTVEGCVAVNPGDIAPALVAYNASVVTSKRTIAIDDFFAVNGEKTTVLDDDEIVTEIQVPTPAAGTKSAFVKYAIRKAFDFPVVNCAAAISGSDASICLNAVYNNPRRATEAEDAIRGQTINDANATAAGEAAVASAVALPGGNNTYMIQIAKTMVKRAILACA
jgi:xanthine dehydrogenase YagS FAD-binding subunit